MEASGASDLRCGLIVVDRDGDLHREALIPDQIGWLKLHGGFPRDRGSIAMRSWLD